MTTLRPLQSSFAYQSKPLILSHDYLCHLDMVFNDIIKLRHLKTWALTRMFVTREDLQEVWKVFRASSWVTRSHYLSTHSSLQQYTSHHQRIHSLVKEIYHAKNVLVLSLFTLVLFFDLCPNSHSTSTCYKQCVIVFSVMCFFI